jgi:hypothetical protein
MLFFFPHAQKPSVWYSWNPWLPVVGGGGKFGGIPDIVTDGVNGHLFDPRDEKGLISATQEITNRQGRKRGITTKCAFRSGKMGLASGHQTIIKLLSPGFEE